MHALVVAAVLAAGGQGEAPAERAGQPLIVTGVVLLGVGAAGLTAGGVSFWLETVSAAALPVFPPAQPNHTVSGVLLGVSGAAAVSGAVLLILGLNQRAQRAVTSWWAPALLPSGALGLSWTARF